MQIILAKNDKKTLKLTLKILRFSKNRAKSDLLHFSPSYLCLKLIISVFQLLVALGSQSVLASMCPSFSKNNNKCAFE